MLNLGGYSALRAADRSTPSPYPPSSIVRSMGAAPIAALAASLLLGWVTRAAVAGDFAARALAAPIGALLAPMFSG